MESLAILPGFFSTVRLVRAMSRNTIENPERRIKFLTLLSGIPDGV